MKRSLSLLFLLSLSAYGQRVDECPRAGLVLKSDFVGVSGEATRQEHKRNGNNDIPAIATLAGTLKARTFRNFRDTVCVAREYIQTVRICNPVAPDLALGRGNGTLAGLYDLRLGQLQRADMFARSVRYFLASSAAERLELGSQVVTVLAQQASVAGMPRNWPEFVAALKAGVDGGLLTLHLFEEIVNLNAGANQAALGFLPMPGVTVTEGRGNQQLAQTVNLRMSPQARASLIQRLIHGITPVDADRLTPVFAQFAAVNGIPSTWDQFALMMRDAQAKGAISPMDLRRVTVDLEMQNRANLGFEIHAEHCRMEDQRRIQNVVESRPRSEFLQDVVKSFQVDIANAPLIAGEEEKFYVTFDGVNPMVLTRPENFNSYQVAGMTEENGVVKFKVEGNRNRIKPRNTLNIKVKKNNGIINLELQDREFNPKLGGKTVVTVKFFDKKLLKDRQVGVETYELTDGNVAQITAKIQNKDISYVKVSMQIIGTPYYNSESSDEVKKD